MEKIELNFKGMCAWQNNFGVWCNGLQKKNVKLLSKGWIHSEQFTIAIRHFETKKSTNLK